MTEELAHTWKSSNDFENVQEVIALTGGRVLLEKEFLLIPGMIHPCGVWPGHERRFNQLIVLQEAYEDACQYPSHGSLSQLLVAPGVERLRCPLALPGRLVLDL